MKTAACGVAGASRRPSPSSETAGVREGAPSDIDDILSLEQLCFTGDQLNRRSVRRLLKSPSAKFLLTSDKRGYALLLFRSNSNQARLYSLAVAPECRGLGIGGTLLAAAENSAAAAGPTSLRLEVRRDNIAASALYEKAGYKMVGASENYYEDGAAAVHYRKELP